MTTSKCVFLAVVSVFIGGVFVLPATAVEVSCPECEDCGRCRDPPQNETVCENHGFLNVQCATGKVIDILYANYGRTQLSSEVCPYRRNHLDQTDCIDPNSLDMVKDECNGKQSCSVQASNSVFGDPCFETYKYLEVRFSCVRSPCPQVSCTALPTYTNGDWNDTRCDSINFQCPLNCQLSCDDGHYISDGVGLVACNASGSYEPKTVPECLPVQCPVPGGVTNGAWNCPAEFRFPGDCTFACNDGYELVSDGGQTTVNCQADSMNDLTNPPSCQEVECSEPPRISNGEWNCTDPCEFHYPEQCAFECDDGYELVPDGGQTTVSCGADGTNDLASIPSCRGVECPVPDDVTNGVWSCPAQFRFPEDCTFECNSGYELISDGGQTTANCQADATNDLISAPSCQGVLCPSPSIVYNGTWTCDNADFRYPDTCTLTCDAGYEPDPSCGQTSVNCLEDASSDLSNEFLCRGVPCPALTNLLIGRWEPPECISDFRYPLTCTLDCPDGYTPSDNVGEVVCLDDQAYDLAESSCVPATSCDSHGGLEALIDGPVYNITDAQLSASSFYDSSYAPGDSRLNKCPSTRDSNCAWLSLTRRGEHITADLGQRFLVGKVATQGDGDTDPEAEHEWVKSFKLFHSNDGVTFTAVDNGATFIGNTDSTSVKEQFLTQYVAARYIRLQVISYNDYPGLRWELYGCLL